MIRLDVIRLVIRWLSHLGLTFWDFISTKLYIYIISYIMIETLRHWAKDSLSNVHSIPSISTLAFVSISSASLPIDRSFHLDHLNSVVVDPSYIYIVLLVADVPFLTLPIAYVWKIFWPAKVEAMKPIKIIQTKKHWGMMSRTFEQSVAWPRTNVRMGPVAMTIWHIR